MKTLPVAGGTARFREQKEIKVRHRQMVEGAAVAAAPALSKLPTTQEELQNLDMSQLGLSREEARSVYDLESAIIVATLIDWTLPDALPNEDTIGDLEPELYDSLKNAIGEIGVVIAGGNVNFEPSDPSGPGFEASPTAPSGGSAADSRVDQESESTTRSQPSGLSTSTVRPTQD